MLHHPRCHVGHQAHERPTAARRHQAPLKRPTRTHEPPRARSALSSTRYPPMVLLTVSWTTPPSSRQATRITPASATSPFPPIQRTACRPARNSSAPAPPLGANISRGVLCPDLQTQWKRRPHRSATAPDQNGRPNDHEPSHRLRPHARHLALQPIHRPARSFGITASATEPNARHARSRNRPPHSKQAVACPHKWALD